MEEKGYTCYDKIRRDIILGFIIVILFNAFGMFFIYKKLKAKIYHTYFMNKETVEKLNAVNIDYNRSTGHINIEKIK